MSTALHVLAVVVGLATAVAGIALLLQDDGSQVGVLLTGAGLALAGFGTRSPGTAVDRDDCTELLDAVRP